MEIPTLQASSRFTAPSVLGAGSPANVANAPSEAVTQALASTYANLSDRPGGDLFPSLDALSSLAGSSNVLGPLMNALYSANAASGKATYSVAELRASSASTGGLNTAMAASLFAGSSDPSGFSNASLTLNSSLALTAYANAQKGIPASGTASSTAKQESFQADQVQQALQGAQAASTANLLNLLG